MSVEIVVTQAYDKTISVLLLNHKIVEFQCVNQEDAVGDIYYGKVSNVVPNIKGAFVEYQKDKTGFLPIGQTKCGIGDELLVQIKKEATDEKQPMLSNQLELPGRYLVLVSDKPTVSVSSKIKDAKERKRLKDILKSFIKEDFGFVIRTNGKQALEEDIKKEASNLIEVYKEMKNKSVYMKPFHKMDIAYNTADRIFYGYLPREDVSVITDIEEVAQQGKQLGYQVECLSREAKDINRRYRIEHYLQEALKKKIWMNSGGFLFVEQTEAMAVIDVNSGKSIGKNKKESHIKKINLEAAKEVARQIRLRNLSGIIIVDFIDMKEKDDQEELLQVMQYYLNQDSKKAVAVDVTKLGLMEITRKKTKNPLSQQIGIDR